MTTKDFRFSCLFEEKTGGSQDGSGQGPLVHLMGICGTGMAGLAGLLLEQGFRVRGSDNGCYPPMSHLLEDLEVPVAIGYRPENIFAFESVAEGDVKTKGIPDLVVIGNVIRADNPEAKYVLDKKIPVVSFPEAIKRFCLGDRKSLVVAGTHGKTTTSSMLVSAVQGTGVEPGFMIGGILKEFSAGFRLGNPPWFVLEGDEYDTAFFDKNPKFLHYRPLGVILTSIEFDHADIYKDIEEIKASFSRLVELVPKQGVIAACGDWPEVLDACNRARCRVVTYGEGDWCDWKLLSFDVAGDRTIFEAIRPDGRSVKVAIPMPGRHNALNALGVLALSSAVGLDMDGVVEGLARCQGVKRRQDVRGVEKGVTVIDDFAHHPSAVRETLQALRAKYAGSRLVAVFEPRTNTSRRSVFQKVYPASFDAADLVLVRDVLDPDKAPPGDRFSSKRLVEDLILRGKEALFFKDANYILAYLEDNVRKGDVIVIMSNGDFEGLHERLLRHLRDRQNGTV